MFTQTGPNEATSDEGFSVKRTKRFELQYLTGSKSVNIEVEPGDGLAVYETSIVEWDNGDRISLNEKNVILDRIGDALKFLNIKYEIE